MKKTLYIGSLLLFVFFVSFLMARCTTKCKDKVLRHFITAYSTTREISFLDVTSHYENLYIISYESENNKFVSIESKGNDLEIFKELARKSGDIGYKEVIHCANLKPLRHRSFSPVPITRIDITCDKDIDQNHQAGKSLNDLFVFLSFSPDKFIRSRYQPLSLKMEEDLKNVANPLQPTVKSIYKQDGNSLEMVYGTLSEIDFSQYDFLGVPIETLRRTGELAHLSWIAPPEGLTDYTLTVEVEYADGVTKSASLHVKD